MPQSPKLTIVKSEPLTVSKSEPLTVTASDKPEQGMLSTIGEGVTDVGAGALKSIPETFLHLARMIASMSGQTQVNPSIDAQLQRFAPTNAMQALGNVGGQVMQAILPQTAVEKAATLAAEAVPAASGLVRAGVRGLGNAAIASAQGGDPLTAGVLGAAIPAIGDKIAPKLQTSAEESMVDALGPSGGSGPRTRLQLKQAKQIAPELLDQRFGGMSNKVAFAKSKQMLSEAKQAVDAAWTGPLQDKDTSRIIDVLQQRRDKLTLLDAASKSRYVPEEAKAADELLAQLQDEVKRATMPNGQADLRELRKIRDTWDQQVNYAAADPSKRGIAPVYRKAADLVRAQINGTDARIAEANAEFSRASKLHDILERTTERNSPGWRAAAMHYGAPAVLGAGIGGYENGYAGAAEGAAIGATFGKVITTPAFRYVSGNAKALLARALESGDQTRIGMALTTVISQMAQSMKSDAAPMATTATITNPNQSALEALQRETLRQYDAATGADREALGLKLRAIQTQLEAIK